MQTARTEEKKKSTDGSGLETRREESAGKTQAQMILSKYNRGLWTNSSGLG